MSKGIRSLRKTRGVTRGAVISNRVLKAFATCVSKILEMGELIDSRAVTHGLLRRDFLCRAGIFNLNVCG